MVQKVIPILSVPVIAVATVRVASVRAAVTVSASLIANTLGLVSTFWHGLEPKPAKSLM